MDDVEIEVFRADTRASRGITAAQIAEVAQFDCAAHPIPNVLGHPAGDKPAIGAVSGFRAEGSSLFAKVPRTAAKIWDGIKDGSILNRSMAFFDPNHEANPTPGKWAPRHLGWIGAAAPGIPGMTPLSSIAKSLAFSADGETLEVLGAPAAAVIYAAEPTATVTVFEAKEEPAMSTVDPNAAPAQKSAAELAFEAREASFAKRLKTQFEASNSSAIDALVTAGKVLPAEAANLKLAFNALDPEADELTFTAGDKTTQATAASHILAFMAGLPSRVPLGGRTSPSREFTANTVDPDASTAAQAGDLTAKARELMTKNPSLSFEAAIEEVSGGGHVD